MLTEFNQKRSLAEKILLRGEENVNCVKTKLLENHSKIIDSDPTLLASLDNAIDSFSSLRLINLNSPESSRQNTPDLSSLKRKRGVKQREILERRTYRTETEILHDGYFWRKYGQKTIKNFHHKRNYFECNSKSDEKCRVKKYAQKIQDNPPVFETIYLGRHICHAAAAAAAAATFSLHPEVSTMIEFENYNQTESDSNLPLLVDHEETIQVEATTDPLMNDEWFSAYEREKMFFENGSDNTRF